MREYKQRILYIVIVTTLLGLITINSGSNVSALSYSSNVGIGFTFSPTLSVSISPSDLIISNLVPGSTLDSNVINVSVASNASYGYTLSAIVNGNNSNLTHSNGTNTFSSIATNADLSDLEDSEDTNIWGYSTSLDSGTTWSDYNGLSSSVSATLLDTNTNNTETGIDSVDFKIAAKASNTQPSGTYTGTINFTAVTKPAPMTLAEAYASEGKTMVNGFYTMQDMTSTICEKTEAIGSQLQVLDIRDFKLYNIAKLKDNKCWMTENLDLAGNTTLSSDTTDFDSTYTIPDTQGWQANGTLPESSATGFSVDNYAYVYNSDSKTCANKIPCYSYYSWDVATLGSGRDIIQLTDAPYSICPKNWRLPTSRNKYVTNWQTISDFYALAHQYGLDSTTSTSENDDGFYTQAGPGTAPDFLLTGSYSNNSFYDGGNNGSYWSASGNSSTYGRSLSFGPSKVESDNTSSRRAGFAVRCLAR